jgi:hypothetical protein
MDLEPLKWPEAMWFDKDDARPARRELPADVRLLVVATTNFPGIRPSPHRTGFQQG